jgi:hypothetical protein
MIQGTSQFSAREGPAPQLHLAQWARLAGLRARERSRGHQQYLRRLKHAVLVEA